MFKVELADVLARNTPKAKAEEIIEGFLSEVRLISRQFSI